MPRKEEKKKRKKKDPNAPKRPKNGFMFFSGEKRAEVVKANPEDKVGDIAKKIGAMWREMDDKQKAPYQKMAGKDKDRYTKAAAAYAKTASAKAYAADQ